MEEKREGGRRKKRRGILIKHLKKINPQKNPNNIIINKPLATPLVVLIVTINGRSVDPKTSIVILTTPTSSLPLYTALLNDTRNTIK